jgi:hypothetical protein
MKENRNYYGSLSSVGVGLILPYVKYMLHHKAYCGNTYPAYAAKYNRFATGFDKLYQITVQSDCSHCHNDTELTEIL